MDNFLKKVDDLLSSAVAKKAAEEKEKKEVEALFDTLCQKVKERQVSLVIFTKEDGAFRIFPQGEAVSISLSEAQTKGPNGKWAWAIPPLSVKEAKKGSWLSKEGRTRSILRAALKNEAEIEIE